MNDNWKPVLLLAVFIPLVLGLQLMALWVIDNLGQQPAAAAAARLEEAEPAARIEPPAQAEGEAGVTATLSGWDEVRNRRRPAETAGDQQPIATEQQSVALIEPQAVPEQTTVAQTALEAAAQPDPAAPEEPAGSLEDNNLLDLHHGGWLEQRDPSRYTLQVETAMTPEGLLTFAEQRQLPQPQAYYRSFWEARERYVYALVSGDYSNWSAARQAADQLSRRYPQLKPWVRSFADIQRQMRQE